MARTLTFIDTADLHIGAPFRGLRNMSSAWADRLLDAIPAAFERIVDEACSRAVDFVVIAGDIFDMDGASFADYRRFFQGVEKLADHGIPVYLCTGNHDPYDTWQKDFYTIPESAFMFSSEHPDFALYERDGEPLCVLGGRGIPTHKWPSEESIAAGITREHAEEVLGARASEAPFGVGVLHTGLDFDAKKAPVNRNELYRAGFDFWALGHIHKRFVDDEQNPKLCFPGNIQGRDITETGRRGINLVTLTEGAPPHIEFIPTADIVWEQFNVDVVTCENIPDIVDEIERRQSEVSDDVQCTRMVSRITLTGSTSLHEKLAQPGVLEDVRRSVNESSSDFFVDVLIDKTVSPRDRDELYAQGLFPATFLRAAQDVGADKDDLTSDLQETLIKKGVRVASMGKAFKNIDKNIDEISEEATNLVLDLLMNKEA